MNEMINWCELKETIKTVCFWAIVSFFDSLFLAIWVIIQWFVNDNIIKPLNLSGINNVVLIIFQVMFAISTLSPVAITIYRNISIIMVRTQRKIINEKESDE